MRRRKQVIQLFKVGSAKKMLWLTALFTVYTMAVPVLILFFLVRPYVEGNPDLMFALYVLGSMIPFFIVPPIALLILNMLRMLSKTLHKLDKMLKKDPLTNACTRSAFLNGVSNSTAATGVFLMLDIDRFKQVNDTLGHDAGDMVLKSVANCLIGATAHCMMGRLGGEEFGVYLPNHELEDGHQFAWELCQLVRDLKIDYNGEELGVTISIGAAMHKQGRPIERTMKQADICLYEAKASGRDRAVQQVLTPMEKAALAA